MTVTTAEFEREGFPRATATLDSVTGRIGCVVDQIAGLAPTRALSTEEAGIGIDSLDPPTVHGQRARDVITRAQLAVSAAVDSTVGGGSPPEILFTRYKTAVSVKGALAALGLTV